MKQSILDIEYSIYYCTYLFALYISEKTLRKPTFNWFNYRRSLDVYALTSLTRTHCAYVQKFKHVRMRTGYVTADFPPSTHARNRMWVCPALFFEAVYLPSSGSYSAKCSKAWVRNLVKPRPSTAPFLRPLITFQNCVSYLQHYGMSSTWIDINKYTEKSAR